MWRLAACISWRRSSTGFDSGTYTGARTISRMFICPLPPVLALSSVLVAGAILTEAALSFLGLGDPNRVTWGGMIAEGRAVLRSAPFLSIIPGLALVASVLGVYLAGEGLVEAGAARRSQS